MNDAILEELRKQTSLLQAIDWKFWEVYNRVMETDTAEIEQVAADQAEEPIDISLVSESTQTPKSKSNIPPYPSIEEWQ